MPRGMRIHQDSLYPSWSASTAPPQDCPLTTFDCVQSRRTGWQPGMSRHPIRPPRLRPMSRAVGTPANQQPCLFSAPGILRSTGRASTLSDGTVCRVGLSGCSGTQLPVQALSSLPLLVDTRCRTVSLPVV